MSSFWGGGSHCRVCVGFIVGWIPFWAPLGPIFGVIPLSWVLLWGPILGGSRIWVCVGFIVGRIPFWGPFWGPILVGEEGIPQLGLCGVPVGQIPFWGPLGSIPFWGLFLGLDPIWGHFQLLIGSFFGVSFWGGSHIWVCVGFIVGRILF